MVHHCMLKETRIIFYIQQASHQWIEGDEEDTTYAQTIESLRVMPTNIQHGVDLLIKYENVFAFSMKDLGKCKTM